MKNNSIKLIGAYGEKNLGDDLLEEIGKLITIEVENLLIQKKNRHSYYVYLYFGGTQFFSFSALNIRWVLYYPYKILRNFLSRLIMWIKRRKKIAIFVGVGPFNNSLAERLAISFLGEFDFISFRDEASYNWAQKLINIKNIKVTRDPVFKYFNYLGFSKVDAGNGIAFILRDWRFLSYTIEKKLLDSAIQISDEFMQTKFITFGKDFKIEKEIRRRIVGSDFVAYHDYSYCRKDEFIQDAFAGSNIIVTMRFHGAILGLLMRKRVIIINIDPKFEQLLNDFDGLVYVIQPNCINKGSLMAGLKFHSDIQNYERNLTDSFLRIESILNSYSESEFIANCILGNSREF